MCTDLKVDWGVDERRLGHVISVPAELYARGCVSDVDEGLVVNHLTLILTLTLTHVSMLLV